MKTFSRIITAIILALSFVSLLSAQQNPPFKCWKYIDAGHYRIIFPEGLEKTAQKTANLMVYYEKYNYAGMKAESEYIPIVIIDDYSEANGFVSSAPFYSHWFTTPSSFDSIDWFTGLAIHEGRHMVQRNRIYGNEPLLYMLLGNYGIAAYEGLFIPRWFLEGDAVVMETALTHGGRGRIAGFPLWYRTLEVSGKRYSYYRAYLGTYDDMFPYANPYSLGYLVDTYVRRKYNRMTFDNAIEIADSSCCYPSFNYGLEFQTGNTIDELYKAAMNEYGEYWKKNLAGITFTESEKIFPERDGTWESYIFPFQRQEGTYALRFARDRKFSLVKVTQEGTDEVRMMPYDVLSPLFKHERSLSAGGDFILWRESVPDPRWGYRTWSDLVLYNIKSDETTRITDEGKFIASTLSSDGTKAAGIEYTAQNGYSLTIFDTKNMNVLHRLDINGMGHIFDPALSAGGKIALCSQDKKGNAIIIVDPSTGEQNTIVKHTRLENFRSPVFHNGCIFYVSDYTGIDNVYAVDLESGKRFQVTSVKYGAYYPAFSGETGELIYNEYTLTGYKTAVLRTNREKWTPFENLKNPIDPYVEEISTQELGYNGKVPEDLPLGEYEVKNYYTIPDGMAVAGWIPYFDITNHDFSFNIMTQDVLHTLYANAAYLYNFNEHTHTGAASIGYYALYPVFTLTGSYGGRALRILDKEDRVNGEETISWMEKRGSLAVSLPLDFSRGIHSTNLVFGAEGGMIEVTEVDPPVYIIYSDMHDNGMLKYAVYNMTLRHTIAGAMNAIFPRWGQVLNLSYSHTPWEADYRGRMRTADLTIFMPSVFSTHGFKFTGGFIQNDLINNNYVFTQPLLFPRGYDEVIHERFISGSADYAFPIADFSLSLYESFESLTGLKFSLLKLMYFKRLNGAVYYDYGRGYSGESYTSYSSAGFELTSVQNIFSNPFLLIEAGLRYSYCFEARENVYGLVVKMPLMN